MILLLLLLLLLIYCFSKYEIVYCYSIIEENKRSCLPVLATPTSGNVSLETIFPFDPYHLKR